MSVPLGVHDVGGTFSEEESSKTLACKVAVYCSFLLFTKSLKSTLHGVSLSKLTRWENFTRNTTAQWLVVVKSEWENPYLHIRSLLNNYQNLH